MVTWKSETIVDALPCDREAYLRDRGVRAGAAEVLVTMRRAASDRMHAHAASSRLEVGGALLGMAYRDDAGDLLVDVVAAIPAEGAQEEGTYFRMTEMAWEKIATERKSLDEDLLIVGWYHTHPGLGIFYSGTDRDSQRAFFTQPWNFGVVIDPQRDGIGYFLGPESIELPTSQVMTYTPPAVPVPPVPVPAGIKVEEPEEPVAPPPFAIKHVEITTDDVVAALRLVAVAAVVVFAVRRARSRR